MAGESEASQGQKGVKEAGKPRGCGCDVSPVDPRLRCRVLSHQAHSATDGQGCCHVEVCTWHALVLQ